VRAAAVALWLAGCPRPAPPPAPEPLPADVPVPRTDGVVAGPRYLVEAPPPPEVPPTVPGQGVLSPYLSVVRRDLADRMRACTTSPSGGGAMLKLSLAADGAVSSTLLARSSGDAAWDTCLLESVAGGGFEPPPVELIEAGVFATDLVFR
jgi:outer membrane biosynthesis protein TonB